MAIRKFADLILKSSDPAVMSRLNNIKSAGSGLPVLIAGPRGTGKDTLARHVYDSGVGSQFVKIDGKSTPSTAIEFLEGATVYVDEIERMSLNAQRRVLSLARSSKAAAVMVSTCMTAKEFAQSDRVAESVRTALLRICVELAPLSERACDIGPMAQYLTSYYCKKYDKSLTLTDEAIDRLKRHEYEANITELDNTIHRLVMLKRDRETLKIGETEVTGLLRDRDLIYALKYDGNPISLKEETDRLEKELITFVISRAGSMTKAATYLRVSQSYMSKRCKALGIKAAGSS